MKLVIDRSKWLRGHSGGWLQKEGMTCSLGFLALAIDPRCGPDIERTGEPDPDQVLWPSWVFAEDEDGDIVPALRTIAIMVANDDEYINEKTREEILTREFKAEGIEVEFIN